MSRKAFVVQVELEVQAVTCPGVWLCSNGKVSLQLYMLNSCVQTGSYKPTFPIIFHEKFAFYKNFYSTHRLSDLQNELSNEWIYLELIQWKNCEKGNVLGSFQTTLDELLFPSAYRGSVAGVDVDLLLETTKAFPGTISPKVEISTRTTIDEIMCSCIDDIPSGVVVNPKLLMSVGTIPKSKNMHRKVCHSIGYSRTRSPFKQMKTKPPFCYRKAEDSLIHRKVQSSLASDFKTSRSLEKMITCKQLAVNQAKAKSNVIVKKQCPCSVRMCACGSGHMELDCPLCSKYKGYFSVPGAPQSSPKMQKKKETSKPLLKNRIYTSCKTHPKCFNDNRCCCCCEIVSSKNQNKDRSPSPCSVKSYSSEKEMNNCICDTDNRVSLAKKLHARLTKTLDSLPKSFEVPCYDDEEIVCDCCNSGKQTPDSPTGRYNRAQLYQDLQKFYGKLYETARRKGKDWKSCCVPDSSMYKCVCWKRN